MFRAHLSSRSLNDRSIFENLNRVVTGIRFLKKGGIIHIFISERELGAYGHIKESSATTSEATTWKSDYNFLVDDSGVTSGRDYHTLTHENRAIDLDIIRAPIDEGTFCGVCHTSGSDRIAV